MKKVIIVGIIVIVLIVSGFILGFIFPAKGGCTEMYCGCEDLTDGDLTERPCNYCSVSNLIFLGGVINFIKVCSGKEIIICENGKKIDEKININKNSCKYEVIFLNNLR